jgi:hypothetical protein
MKEIISPAKAEKVNTIILRSNFKDLTPETLLESFKAEGIRSLEDLARRFTTALRDPEGLPQPIPYEELFARPTPRDVVAAIKHPVPQIPFIVDGVEHDPEDIVRYNGQELAYIPQKGGTELLLLKDKSVWGPLVQTALLSRAVSTALLPHDYPSSPRSVGGPPDATTLNLLAGGGVGPVPDPPPPWTAGFVDINMDGDGLWLYSGESRRDLTKVSWGLFDDFNDKFSSLHRTTSLCMAFEHIHFKGSSFFFGPSYENWLDLRTIGWNDRISSFINGG